MMNDRVYIGRRRPCYPWSHIGCSNYFLKGEIMGKLFAGAIILAVGVVIGYAVGVQPTGKET